MTCELCEFPVHKMDPDMGIYLCRECYESFNGEIVEIELNEVY